MRARIEKIIKEYSAQGIHRTGTAVDNASADWLVDQIRALGVTATTSPFQIHRLIVNEAMLTSNALTIAGVPLYDCDFAQHPASISGQLGELHSDAKIGVTMAPPFEQSAPFRAINTARRSGKHQAIVVMTDEKLPDTGIALVNAESYQNPFGPPVLQIASQHRLALQNLLDRQENVRLTVDAHRTDTEAFNVEATITGSEPRYAPVVVMTPRSGWWQCASERGGGIATLLEIVRACVLNQPKRTVIFTASSGHELSHLGLDHYLEQHHSLIKDAYMWVHLGANFVARNGDSVRLQHSDEEVRNLLAETTNQENVTSSRETKIGERPVGEARNIFDGGGRFVSIVGSNSLFHHPADTYPSAVDIEVGMKWIKAMTNVTLRLANDVS